MGVKESEWTRYDEGGRMTKKINYREGMPFGKVLAYYDNGRKRTEGQYDDLGEKTGI